MKFRLAIMLCLVMFMPSCSKKGQPRQNSAQPAKTPSTTDTTARTDQDTTTQPKADATPVPVVTWKPGQAIRVPGSPIVIAPPQGFELADTFVGLVRKDKGASIKIAELPNSLSQTTASLADKDALEKRQMAVVSDRKVELGSNQGHLYQVKQTLLSRDFGKWILVVGDDRHSAMVTATFPNELTKELSQEMEKSLLTVKWEPKSPAEFAAELPFAIKVEPPFKLATKMGDTLIYTDDGEFPLSKVGDPVIYLTSSLARFPVSNPRAFAETRLTAIPAITDVNIVESTSIEVDTLGAHEVLAEAKATDSGKPLFLYQLMIFQQDNYYTITGLVDRNEQTAYENTFRRIGRSFVRKTH